jgi:hypothetical protein
MVRDDAVGDVIDAWESPDVSGEVVEVPDLGALQTRVCPDVPAQRKADVTLCQPTADTTFYRARRAIGSHQKIDLASLALCLQQPATGLSCRPLNALPEERCAGFHGATAQESPELGARVDGEFIARFERQRPASCRDEAER